MEQDVKTLNDYMGALRRRKGQLVLVMLVILITAGAVAYGLPSIYRSTGTILIEQQEIPQDLVRTTVTSFADQRIQVIGQRVMTTTNLVDIIQRYNLYPEERAKNPLEAVVEKMRSDISVEMVSADVVDQRTGKATKATIAFNVSYDSKSPDLAQRVANELVTLYLNENLKTRTQQAQDTSSFLGDEGNRLREQILELERKLAEFKEQNAGQLPELTQLNLQLMDRTEREMLEAERQIRSLEERQILLQAQLAQINPLDRIISETGERILTPGDRLKVLRSQHASLTALYAPDHPDVVKARKEIEALEAQTGLGPSTTDLEKRLLDQRRQLVEAEKRYSPEHPDVKRLQRSVAALEADLASAGRAVATRAAVVQQPDNPAYIQLRSQLQAAETDLKGQRNKLQELRQKLEGFEQRLVQTPQVEREYKALSRDYETAVAKYQEVKAKEMQAQLAESLESERKGERFTLIQPPLLPEEPVKPNRLAILFLGVVFSFAGGIGTAAVAESLDTSVRGAKGVTALLGAPPLSVVPFMETDADRRRRFLKRLLTVLFLMALLGLALLAFHWLVMPLDVAWYSGLRRFGL